MTNRDKKFSKATHLFLVFAIGSALLHVTPMYAQSADAPQAKSGSILGTVLDNNDDPIPDARVVLQGASGDAYNFVTKDDGAFAFENVAAGDYQLSATAQGFGNWESTVTVEPGQNKAADIKLRIAAVQRAVTVGYAPQEIAKQQLKVEEQQRMLGFIPNIYVVYDPHPEPLTTKMKFHLAYKSMTHPTFFGFMAVWAGIQQAANTPDWPQTAKGYGERFGANLAGGATEGLFGNAILPSLLHQDPRYYYQGTGTAGSRFRHAAFAPFITPGDNGKWQPNYSLWGGLLISGALANTYYPESNRGAGLMFKNFGTNMGLHVALGLAQEFILAKFTSRGKHH